MAKRFSEYLTVPDVIGEQLLPNKGEGKHPVNPLELARLFRELAENIERTALYTEFFYSDNSNEDGNGSYLISIYR